MRPQGEPNAPRLTPGPLLSCRAAFLLTLQSCAPNALYLGVCPFSFETENNWGILKCHLGAHKGGVGWLWHGGNADGTVYCVSRNRRGVRIV